MVLVRFPTPTVADLRGKGRRKDLRVRFGNPEHHSSYDTRLAKPQEYPGMGHLRHVLNCDKSSIRKQQVVQKAVANDSIVRPFND